MKKTTITTVLLALILVFSSCSKTTPKTTGHLYVRVDMTSGVNSQALPSTTKTGAEGRVYLGQTNYNPLAYAIDSTSSSQKIKTLDFGELNPGNYNVLADGFIYSNGAMAGPLGSGASSMFQVSAGQDATVTVTLQ